MIVSTNDPRYFTDEQRGVTTNSVDLTDPARVGGEVSRDPAPAANVCKCEMCRMLLP